MLVQAGVHPRLIQTRIGHSDIRATFGVYGAIFDGMDRAAAYAVDAVYERANGDAMGSLDADSG